MGAPVFAALLNWALITSARGHGAVTQPYARKLATQMWCPWCIGEHQPLSNPMGKSHHDAKPSSPCMGTSRGAQRYNAQQYGRYASGPGPTEYRRGQSFESRVVLDADHNGDAQWGLCPHSDGETEDCFRKHPLTQWTDVHSYWDPTNTQDHWKSGETYPQTVTLPSSTPVGPATLRWLWVCKYTDEIFVSCIDIDVKDSAGVSPTPAPVTATPAPTSPAMTTPSPTAAVGGDVECLWTDPPGRTVQRTPREQKAGRTCWDFVVDPGTTVHYQTNTDIYITWNVQACCLRASEPYASATGAPANIVSFTPAGSNFGFCECSAWDPNNPGVSCAGSATAANMVCPVDSDDSATQRNHGMCADSTTLDNLPVKCDGPVSEPEPESEPERASEPENAPEPEAEPESEPTSEPETGPEPEPEGEPEPEPISANTPVPSENVASNCVGEHQTCGGANWAGATCCQAGLLCEYMNPWHSRCVRVINDGPCTDLWKQCGGLGWSGATCCAAGLTCKRYNDHYSQCAPQSSLAQVKRHGNTLLRGQRDTVGGVLMQQAVKLDHEEHGENDETLMDGDIVQGEFVHTHEEL